MPDNTSEPKKWLIYEGSRQAKSWGDIEKDWPEPPPWRDPRIAHERGRDYIPGPEEKRAINAAIHLRRPVLVTGRPGTGKSSLAYSVARELGLGSVLHWPISTKSTLRDGIYSYDAIGRLQADDKELPITSFMRLGPLGTALQSKTPRVVLIDEIDKSDVDLPNDLLNVLDEGTYLIEELARLRSSDDVHIRTHDHEKLKQADAERVRQAAGAQPDPNAGLTKIEGGMVGPPDFTPIVILTSNGEREFPAPFLRRCIRLNVQSPDREKLREIVGAHILLPNDDWMTAMEAYFPAIRQGDIATDQLLNAIFVITGREDIDKEEKEHLKELLMKKLQESDG